MKHFLLYYAFGPDYRERRAGCTEPHMAYLKAAEKDGSLVLGGACMSGDGDAQGVYLLRADTREAVEAFAKADPYVSGNVADGWHIREWTTVAGRDATMKM